MSGSVIFYNMSDVCELGIHPCCPMRPSRPPQEEHTSVAPSYNFKRYINTLSFMYLGVAITRIHSMVDCNREEYTHHPRLLPENTVGQSISCPTQTHADEYRVASED